MNASVYNNESKQRKATLRVVIFTLSIVLACLLPWWVAVLYGAFMILWFQMYEMVMLGVLLDALYITPDTFILQTALPLTVTLLLCVPCSWFTTQYVRNETRTMYA